jgi:predicted DsbA family dithiol-disulfide isomerase
VRWTHFPLHPDTPDSGLSLEELFRGRGYDIEAMKKRMSDLMAEESLPYGNRSHTYNSRLAQELSKWGESFPEREALNQKLFEAYFVEGRNLAEPDVLLAVAEATGLSRKAAEGGSGNAASRMPWTQIGDAPTSLASPECRPSFPATGDLWGHSLMRRWSS